jgi:hypothetical protein
MSKITLVSPISGTAEFSITTPSGTSTDRTLTLPDAGGTVVSDTATQTLSNKTLTSPTLTTPNINSAQFATVTGTAPLYAARAWVNFNGTGTVAIRASGNVSSITDNGTGQYTVNFTTAMPDANYAPVAMAGLGNSVDFTGSIAFGVATASALSFGTGYVTTVSVSADNNNVSVGIFR